MGAGASVPDVLDEATTKLISGDAFNQDIFDSTKDADGNITSAQLMEAWLQSHGIQGKKLAKILEICEKELIGSPDELRQLHEKDELKDTFKQSILRISLENALQAKTGEDKAADGGEKADGSVGGQPPPPRQLEEWQVLVGLRDNTGFADWRQTNPSGISRLAPPMIRDNPKDGWGTLEEHHDPSRCAGVTMESGKITKIVLESSNVAGGMPAMSGFVALTLINLNGNTLTAAGLEPFCSNPPPNLMKLEMAGCRLQGMPAMSGCVALTTINLNFNKLTAAGLEPFCSSPPPNLTGLVIMNCGLQELPQSIGDLSSLEILGVSGNKELKELPSTIGSLLKLKTLIAHSCALSDAEKQRVRAALPNCKGLVLLAEWQVLVELRDNTGFADWSHNKDGWGTLEEHHNPSRCAGVTMKRGKITKIVLKLSNVVGELPKSIGDLSSLEDLEVFGNTELKALPSTIGSLSKLKYLSASGCALSELPSTIGSLTNLKTLLLSRNALQELPESIGDLSSLEELNLYENKELKALPSTIGSLSNLKDLNANGCGLSDAEKQRVRDALPNCKDLRF